MVRILHRNIKKVALLFLILMLSSYAKAQNISIHGTVRDSSNNSTIVGVNVLQKGTQNGIVTDNSGNYKLEVPKGSTIIFSFMGYTKKEIIAHKEGKLDVALSSSIKELDELIVIGYSTQKKTDKTGAVSNVQADDLNGGVLTDAIQGMQGKAAGVSITKKGGDPNSGFSVRIRGASGFNSNTQPLYVIDGVAGADPTIIAAEDIASYNILKDAASTAIYGSRGSNGVIIITTKSGKSAGGGKFSKVEFSSQVSVDKVSNKYNVLSANEMRGFTNTLLKEAQVDSPHYVMEDVFNDGGASTDWQNEIFRTGISTSTNLSLSGGNSTNTYYASLTRASWGGVMRGTSKDRTTARINVTHKAFKNHVTFSGSLLGSFEKNDYENYSGWGKDDIIYQALQRNPTDPVYNSDGTYYKSSRVFNYENPVAVINEVTNNRDNQKFLGNFRTDYEIIEGLVASLNYSYIRDDASTNYFRPNGLYASADNGFAKKQSTLSEQQILEFTTVYNKTIKKNHNLNLLGGYSWQETIYSGFYAQGRDAQSNYSGPDNLAVLNDVVYGDIGSWKGKWNLIGFFGRAQYNYKSKYYVSASIRRDGSSKFGENNRWGWFPTAAIGWTMSNESFLKNTEWLSILKLRASYGISGNQEIGEYHSIVVWEPSGKATNPETGQQVITFKPAWNANPDLKWEQTSEINLGIDFGFFDNKLSGSFELYRKKTSDLLGEYNVPVPPNLAYKTFANSGSLTNNGIELFIQAYAYDRKNFKWRTSLVFAHNKTIITDLGNYFNEEDGVRKEGYISGRGMVGEEYYVTGIMEGEETGSFYVPTYVTLKDGKFIYESVSGGYTDQLSEAKRTIVGTAAPDFEIGWSNTFTLYKRWNIDFALRSMIGNSVYNATRMFFDNPGNLPSLNAYPDAIEWREDGRTSGSSIADIYVEDASFVKLDYISVSYDFNMEKTKVINNIRIFISANNVFTLTKYSGVDPETSIDGLAFGIDQYNVYPKTRSITFGLKATF
ncbi:MAG: SusC/RagA family TonB-linked outer membrane protein [Bacteroidales bacterium]|nr:SusC/RagA family TonB-linked outer membrane protein [Bacteroidales bacterium]